MISWMWIIIVFVLVNITWIWFMISEDTSALLFVLCFFQSEYVYSYQINRIGVFTSISSDNTYSNWRALVQINRVFSQRMVYMYILCRWNCKTFRYSSVLQISLKIFIICREYTCWFNLKRLQSIWSTDIKQNIIKFQENQFYICL